MAGIPVNATDVLQFRTWVSQAEQGAVVTFYYGILSQSGTPTTDLDCANAIDAILAPKFKSILSTDASYRGTQAVIINRPVRPAPVISNLLTGAGSAAPPDLPRQTCGLISWRTPFSGRRYRGRMYVPFPPAVDNGTDGVPIAGYITVLSNIGTALMGLTTINNAAVTGSVGVSFVLNHGKGKTPIPAVTPITSFTAQNKWATQRKRGSYGKANVPPF
jgi:hypothetical protein